MRRVALVGTRPQARRFVWPKRVAFAVLLGVLARGSTVNAGEPARLNAHVVWWQGDLIYLAAPDSLTLEPGALLRFLDKKKTVATGEVLSLFEQSFIVAKLTSGSFRKIKHPDRLAVFAEPPPRRVPAKLRLGYPAPARHTLFFACDSAGIDLPSAGFEATQTSDHAYQLVRRPEIPDTASWPDTLVLRFFDDAADEEIALERGELDGAMFWPGEASPHIRDKMRWAGEPSGLRTRGIVAALFLSFHATQDSLTTAVMTRRVARKLNDDLFRGDLAPCGTSVVDTSNAPLKLAMRFDVDPTMPGHDDLQKALDRAWKTHTVAKATDLARIAYLDVPLDSLTTPLMLAGMKKPIEPSAIVCLLRIRCPILCSPASRAAIESVGADRIVNLLRCRPRPATP